ncbi:17934_t:CDS:2, partial [Cetraspora pellucida]
QMGVVIVQVDAIIVLKRLGRCCNGFEKGGGCCNGFEKGEQTNSIENASIHYQESSCSINSLLNLEHANISTLLIEFTESMFTEFIEPTKFTFTESTKPIFTKSTEPTFTKFTKLTKLIEFIKSIESNGMFVKFTKLTTSFILVKYTESIAFVDSIDFTSAPIESIEYAEASKSTKSKTTKSKQYLKKHI